MQNLKIFSLTVLNSRLNHWNCNKDLSYKQRNISYLNKKPLLIHNFQALLDDVLSMFLIRLYWKKQFYQNHNFPLFLLI